MDRVAAALGEPARASPWKRQLARLKAVPQPSRDAIFLGAGGNSVGAQSVEAEWMRLAGLRQRVLPGGRASLELLATRPPAILLRSAYRRTERSLGQVWLDHPLAKPKASRIVTVDGRPWTCAGPLMLERSRTAEASSVRLLVIALLLGFAAAHLLLPLGPLQEAQAIDPGLADLILVELRLPRTLLVLGYGAVLGISGAALQAMFANPLASPDISGASSGAALGAVVGGYWLGLTQPLLLAACGAAGALGYIGAC